MIIVPEEEGRISKCKALHLKLEKVDIWTERPADGEYWVPVSIYKFKGKPWWNNFSEEEKESLNEILRIEIEIF